MNVWVLEGQGPSPLDLAPPASLLIVSAPRREQQCFQQVSAAGRSGNRFNCEEAIEHRTQRMSFEFRAQNLGFTASHHDFII
jgi:hypothetical protein